MDSSRINYGSVEYKNYGHNKGNKEIHVIWDIPNFMNLLKNEDILEIRTPEPTEVPSDELKFHLKIMFIRGNWSCEQIYINYSSSTLLFLKSVQLKTYIFDLSRWVYEQEQSIITQNCEIVEPNKCNFLVKLLVNDSYIKVANNICLLRNGSLRLKLEFVVTIENETKENHFQTPATQLINDFENLLHTGMFSDVIMKSTEDEDFKVHKAVLASRSSVLKGHFEHNTTESITNIVASPLESTVLREVLSFIYTDKAPNLDQIPEKLLAAADYYQLSQLKSLCEEALHMKLSVQNAIEILQLADLHSANTLKTLTLEFIKQDFGHLKLITKTEGWAKLQSVDLMRRIYE